MFAHTNLITYESLYSSSYLLNEYLLYDKLWGPSQRVVTLFLIKTGLEQQEQATGKQSDCLHTGRGLSSNEESLYLSKSPIFKWTSKKSTLT